MHGQVAPAKRTTVDYASKSDIAIPGVHILLNKKICLFRRFVWAFLLLASTTVCFYQAIDRLLLFISSPVEMVTRIDRADTIKFPSFTICPLDINSMPEIRKMQINFAKSSKGDTLHSVWNLLNFGLTNEQIWQLNSINTNNTKVELKMKKTLPLTKPLSNLTMKSALAYIGTCMTVITDSAMDFMGPALVLSIKQLIDVDDDPSVVDSPAFVIYAHMDGLPAKHHAFFKGNIILRNHQTAIAFTKSKFTYLNRSSYRCVDSVTSAYCWTNCIEKRHSERVNCKLPYMSKNAPNCTTPAESQATYDMTLKMYMETKPQDCMCPNPCKEEFYGLGLDVQGRFRNSTTLEIYFQTNTMMVVEEKYSYDLVTFVCDLGGNLGFYLGVSLLTILALVEYLFAWCKSCSIKHVHNEIM